MNIVLILLAIIVTFMATGMIAVLYGDRIRQWLDNIKKKLDDWQSGLL